jgi:hypothetical protein
MNAPAQTHQFANMPVPMGGAPMNYAPAAPGAPMMMMPAAMPYDPAYAPAMPQAPPMQVGAA